MTRGESTPIPRASFDPEKEIDALEDLETSERIDSLERILEDLGKTLASTQS